jgi:hypothetical protein
VSFRTFGDLRSQVEIETDTQGEEFVSESEVKQYFNSAVTLCEATIVKLGLREKYLQAEALISTVVGQADYDLPSDIVANKIRKVIYRNNTAIYTLKPLRSENSYVEEDLSNAYPANEFYHYSLYKIGTAMKMRLTPKASQSVTNAIRMIYFKTLGRYVADTDVCDVPDICYEYIMSYVRYRIYAKESPAIAQDEKQNMQALLGLMQETLQNQVADPDMDLMDQDFSHYYDMN